MLYRWAAGPVPNTPGPRHLVCQGGFAGMANVTWTKAWLLRINQPLGPWWNVDSIPLQIFNLYRAMIAYNCAEPEVCVQLWWLGICLLWSSKFITGRYVGCFSRAMYLHIVSRFHLCCSPQHSNFWMFIFPNVGSSIAPKRWKSWKPGDDGQGIKKHHPDPSWKYLARRSALSSRVTLW